MRLRPLRRSRPLRAALSALLLGAVLTSCASADVGASGEPSPSVTSAGPGTDPSAAAPTVGSIAPATGPCAIATGCTVPADPMTFDVDPLPPGWTIADATAAERGPATPADAVVRVLTTPAGERVWISLLRGDQSLLAEHPEAARTLDGGWQAFVFTAPMRNDPPDVVEATVVVPLRDDLFVQARGQAVPPDEVVAAVQSLVIA